MLHKKKNPLPGPALASVKLSPLTISSTVSAPSTGEALVGHELVDGGAAGGGGMRLTKKELISSWNTDEHNKMIIIKKG